MTTTIDDLTLTLSRHIPAPPERVFDAWLDPVMLARFMTPKAGMTVPKAQTDPVVGGRFDMIMLEGDEQIPHAGTYKEITRYSRLAFTWESPFSLDDSVVTLDFAPRNGGTDLTLTHTKFATDTAREAHRGGWTHILGVLAETF